MTTFNVAGVIRDRGPEIIYPAEAVFDPSRTYRYLLTRTWNPAWPPAVFIMLNPSTADAFTLDPTIRRCMTFARTWCAGGIRVVNLFAYRAVRPSALSMAGNPVGDLNDEFIRRACEPSAAVVVAAWGAYGAADRAAEVTLLLDGTPLYCLGTTKGGHPRHPLYVPGSTPLEPYGETP